MSIISDELKDEAVELVKYFAKNAIAVWDRREAQKFVAKLPVPKTTPTKKFQRVEKPKMEIKVKKKKFPDEDDE